MNLRGAFIWSVLIHVGFFGLRPPRSAVPPMRVLRPLELTFLETRQEPKQPTPLVPAPGPVHDLTIVPSVSSRTPAILPARQEGPVVPTVLLRLRSKTKQRGVVMESRVAVSIPEGEFASLTYRKQVRERLKSYLRYPNGWVEGMVRLKIRIAADGQLKEARVVEASSTGLDDFCLEGVRGAAPYPRFPKEMAASEVDYEFLVWYRPE